MVAGRYIIMLELSILTYNKWSQTIFDVLVELLGFVISATKMVHFYILGI